MNLGWVECSHCKKMLLADKPANAVWPRVGGGIALGSAAGWAWMSAWLHEFLALQPEEGTSL